MRRHSVSQAPPAPPRKAAGEPRSGGVRARWAAVILGTAALAAGHGAWLLATAGVAGLLPAALGVVLGVAAVDFVGGLVHWACDTWGDEQTPWIGEGVIRFFREHHRAPLAMLQRDWIEVNGQAAQLALPWLVAMAMPPAASWLAARPLVYGFAVSLTGVGAFANQLHRWAHTPRPPRSVRRLQRAGWILSPARHAPHHRAPHTGHYCISSGWLNGPLDALGFWRGLERAITRLTGARPRRGESLPSPGPAHPAWRNDEAGRMARQGGHR